MKVVCQEEPGREFDLPVATPPSAGDEIDVDDHRLDVVRIRWTYIGDNWFPIVIAKDNGKLAEED